MSLDTDNRADDTTVVAAAPTVDVQRLNDQIVVELSRHAVPAAIALLIKARDNVREYYGVPTGIYELEEDEIGTAAHAILDAIMPDDKQAVPGFVHDELNKAVLGDGLGFIHTKGDGGQCEVIITVVAAPADDSVEDTGTTRV